MIKLFNTNLSGPKTHVFLIGVGGYTYLKDGDSPRQQSPELSELGQLTSPVPSVLALYNKVLEYNEKGAWSQPLGSVEMLISNPPGSTIVLPETDILPATLMNIQSGYYSWKARCNENEDNVALFYFCGHGFQKKHHYLLAEDFGSIPQNPWLGAFNFDDTRDAFYSCNANTPVFVVDACRQVTMEMLSNDLTIAPIENPSLFNPEESKNHLTLKATASGQAAYGKKNQPSYLVQALISGMDGLVAKQDENDLWHVETSSLGTNIHQLLELINPEQSYKQRCQVTCGLPVGILKRTSAPTAWLEVNCTPDDALAIAELSCKEQGVLNPEEHKRSAQPGKWLLNIKSSNYQISAAFVPGTGYVNSSKHAALIPPVKRINISCNA
jgi:hypothetical protein